MKGACLSSLLMSAALKKPGEKRKGSASFRATALREEEEDKKMESVGAAKEKKKKKRKKCSDLQQQTKLGERKERDRRKRKKRKIRRQVHLQVATDDIEDIFSEMKRKQEQAEKDEQPEPHPRDSAPEDDLGFLDSQAGRSQRRRTEEGYRIYTAEELGINPDGQHQFNQSLFFVLSNRPTHTHTHTHTGCCPDLFLIFS